jgi:Zn-dependent M28 family amino/carboxypeptidase
MTTIDRRVAVFIVIVAGGLVLGITGLYLSMIRMPLRSFTGPLLELTEVQRALRDELRGHVEALAGLGERSVYESKRLAAAAAYIENALAQDHPDIRRQSYRVADVPCVNLDVEIRGRSRPDEIVVVGAHYDSVPGSPGANDNASGVAGALALARRFRSASAQRTLRIAAFVNEEPPHFQTESMGSLVYARAARQRGDNIVAMLSLETIGYYSDRPRSQHYPPPLGLFYPSTGDFICFVGNTRSAGLVRECVRQFRGRASFPSEGGALPGAIPGVGWSDHWAFWQVGYPAVMITDTAPFRYPYYHTSQDTPDRLDYERIARVVDGLQKVVQALVQPAPDREF